MFLFLFRSSLADFTRPRRLLPWILVLLALGLMGIGWKFIDPRSTPSDLYAQVSSVLLFRVVALMSALFTTAIISQEVEQRTISYLLTRPIARRDLILARFLASVVVVVGLGFFGSLAISAATFGGNIFANPHLWKDLQAMIFAAFAYGGAFLLISLLVNRSMLICLLYAFGWETMIPNMQGNLYYTSIFSHMQTIAQHPAGSGNVGGGNPLVGFLSGSMGVNTLTSNTAMTTLVLITIFTAVVSAWWFNNFEYVPREDAE